MSSNTAKKASTEATTASRPPPPSRVFPVDAGSDVNRRIWLVKVPEIVADIVASSTAAPTEVGTFVTVAPPGGLGAGAGAGAGATASAGASSSSAAAAGTSRKRQRVQLKVELNRDRVTAALGPDALGRTPLKFDLTLEDPIGARLLTRAHAPDDEDGAGASSSAADGSSGPSKRGVAASATGFTLSGLAAHNGAMKPEISDPAYTAYVAWRRSQDKAAASREERKSTLARAEDVAASQQRARQEALALLAAGGPSGKDKASIATVPRAGSVLQAFEKAPVWSLKQLMESTGQPEASVRTAVLQYCEYVRAGPHAGKYVLKQEFRTAATPSVPAS